jgi:large subunit ribosomal protein L2
MKKYEYQKPKKIDVKLKYYKPITSSMRQLITIDTSQLNTNNLETNKKKIPRIKNKSIFIKKSAGRNNTGKITVRHQGGGHKRYYRYIDYKRKHYKAFVQNIEYDPNRNAFIARCISDCKKTNSNSLFYILAPLDLKIGDYIYSVNSDLNDSWYLLGHSEDQNKIPFKSLKEFIKIGNSLLLKNIPIGSFIHNVEGTPGYGGIFERSAGTFAQIISSFNNKVMIKLSSGEYKVLDEKCKATIGIVSNIDHKHTVIGKAGRSRWLNKRPTVRGVAQNPVDHPHGGGEGKSSGGRKTSVTKYGKIAIGKPTRNKKKPKLLKKKIVQN